MTEIHHCQCNASPAARPGSDSPAAMIGTRFAPGLARDPERFMLGAVTAAASSAASRSAASRVPVGQGQLAPGSLAPRREGG